MSNEPLSPNEKASLPRFSKPISLSSSPSSKNSSAVQSPANAKYKTQICTSFDQTGTCPYNSKCLFAHGSKELRTPTQAASRRQSVNAVVVSMQAAGRLFSSKTPSASATSSEAKTFSFAAPRQWVKNPSNVEGSDSPKSSSSTGEKAIILFKTELCRSFASTGSCPYGNKCQFAHGDDELRPVNRHKNYKTTKCEKFHSTGNCPFGLRCIFIHDEDERELPNSESFDSEYASRARQRRASEQYERLKAQEESKELTGEFLRERFSETEVQTSVQTSE